MLLLLRSVVLIVRGSPLPLLLLLLILKALCLVALLLVRMEVLGADLVVTVAVGAVPARLAGEVKKPPPLLLLLVLVVLLVLVMLVLLSMIA